MNRFLWQFQDLNVAMMEDQNGSLFTTTPVLAGVLGLHEDTIRSIARNHVDELDGNCVQEMHAIEFLKANREAFGLSYVRGDMHVWSEDDMILIAGLTRTQVGKQFRKEMVRTIKQQARKTLITKEYFDAIVTQLTAQNAQLQQRLDGLEEREKAAASASGSALAQHRYAKQFRS